MDFWDMASSGYLIEAVIGWGVIASAGLLLVVGVALLAWGISRRADKPWMRHDG